MELSAGTHLEVTGGIKKGAVTSLGSAKNDAVITTTSTDYVDLITVTIMTTGEEVFWSAHVEANDVDNDSGWVRVMRDGVEIGAPSNMSATFVAMWMYVDAPAAGSHTYKLQGKKDAGLGAGDLKTSFHSLFVMEVKR